MEIRVLRYFLTVVREESITKAAEALHITQPTLSRQLAQLEDEAGVKLFDRGSRKIVLTNEGLLLRRRAEEITDLVDKTQRELSEQEELIEGCVSLGCGELAAVGVLPEIFRSFHEKYPLVTYDLFTATADQVKERMDGGLIDIGLLLEPINMDKYDYIRLGVQERWVVLMRPDDELAAKNAIEPKDLAGKNVIMARRSHVQNELANWFGEYLKDIHVLFRSNLTTNGAIMVQNGLGYSLVVEGSAPVFWDPEKICYRPLSPELSATSVLAWKRQQPFGKATMKFLDHMKEYLGTD